MTKNEYLLRLDEKLTSLPDSKKNEVLKACENRFQQNGYNREQQTIQELGPPEALAGSILRKWQQEQAQMRDFPKFQPKPDIHINLSKPSKPSLAETDHNPEVPQMPKMPDFDPRIVQDDFLYSDKIPDIFFDKSEPKISKEEQTPQVNFSDIPKPVKETSESDPDDQAIPRQPHGFRYDRHRGGWLAPEDWRESDYPDEYEIVSEDDEEEINEDDKTLSNPIEKIKRKKQIKLTIIAAAVVIILLVVIPLLKNLEKVFSFLFSSLVLCFGAGLILVVKGIGTFLNGLTMLADSLLNGALCSSIGLAMCGAGCIIFGLTLAAVIQSVPIIFKACYGLIRKLHNLRKKGGQA